MPERYKVRINLLSPRLKVDRDQ